MRGFHGLAWRGLRARPLRTSLTILGVALGVAVLYAGLATDAGIDAAVDRSVRSLVGRADLRIAAFGEKGLSAGTLAAVSATPGVALAAPTFERRTYLGGGLLGPGPLPDPVVVVGIDPRAEPQLHELTLVAGRALEPGTTPDALVSASLAREDGIDVGDQVALQGVDAPVYLRVIGLLDGDGPWSGATGRALVTRLSTAQRVFGDDGITRIDIGLAPGADPAATTQALVAALRSEPYVLSSPTDLGRSLRASTQEFASTSALIAVVALFAGAFLIWNALSMTVVERIRELGLLRAAGASRRQITGYVLLQASVIGVVGSAIGVLLGGLLAGGIVAWLGSVGSVRLGPPELAPLGAGAALLIGLGVTLASALEPARRAGRIPPVEALKARVDLPAARQTRLTWLLLVFGLVALVGAVAAPSAGGASLVRALAVEAVLLGAALALPLVLPVLARIAGLPFLLLTALEERLARASVLRDRGRAALTVGALTVGLAMVVALGGVGQYARSLAGAWIGDVVPGELVLTSIFPRGLDEGLDETIGELPGVASVSPFARFDLAVDGARLDGAAMVGADLADDGRLRFIDGDRDAAFDALDSGGSIIVPSTLAGREGWSVGRTIPFTAADGSLLDLRVVGIVERTLPGTSGEAVLIGWPDAERLGVVGADAFAVRFVPTATAAERSTVAETARSLALDPVPLDRIQGAIGSALDRVFGLFDALSLVAVVVAALGIVNTLTMNVLERVREIGVLRAAGMTRRQVWRSVVVEAGITGIVGAISGVAAGIVVGGLMVALSGGRWDLASAVPWLAVAVAFVLGIALAMLAAAYPARVASGISIVRAVGYE